MFRRLTIRIILLPLVSVGAAALLRSGLTPLLADEVPLLVFILPIIVSAVWGGPPAGLIATVLGAVAGLWLFVPPAGSLLLTTRSEVVRLGIFLIEGLVITWLVARIEAAQRHLVSARDQAQAANRAKDVFIGLLSHELRTPLNVIVGYSRMLSVGDARLDDVKRVAAIVQRNAEHQTRLIDDLLDVQQIGSGGLELHREPLELAPIVQSVLQSLLPLAEAKGLQGYTKVEPATVQADPTHIRKVIWHLASNAIKFTPDGGHYGIAVAERESSVQIRVENSGEGLLDSFRPHVFKPFQQQDMSTTRPHGGLGLGLWIVKHIVETHGGTVDVESSHGGTVFSVSLPKGAA
jgi:signal transduction histidine kinase